MRLNRRDKLTAGELRAIRIALRTLLNAPLDDVDMTTVAHASHALVKVETALGVKP